MVTYEKLRKKPQVANSLIGMSLSEFDELHLEFKSAYTKRQSALEKTRRDQTQRQRRVGAGRKHTYDLRDRLLMTLFWLRAYMTYEVLGFFYDLNKTNIEDNLKDVMDVLERLSQFNFERPAAERTKLRSVQAVMDAFPDVRLVIDAKEQRIERPTNKTDNNGNQHDQQKPYYSGKKKTHTLKNQVAVAPDGLLEAVSASVPGGAIHDLTLLRQSDWLSKLAEGEAAMLDKGYDGITADYPDKKLYLPFKARRNHPLTDEQKAYNAFLSKYRIVVEHTIAQLNKFQVLGQRFRHQLSKHSGIFRLVSALVNRRIRVHPLKQYAPA
jgi:DDE superfamily endonuclease